MPRATGFRAVESIGRTLPDVEVTTTWGQRALKVRGRLFVCAASHPSAELNSLVVMMDFAARDALLEDDPDTYYLKDHYVSYRACWSGCHGSSRMRFAISLLERTAT